MKYIEHFFLQFKHFPAVLVEFQAIFAIGFRFSYITNGPNKSTIIKNLKATCPFFREVVLSFCLRIRQITEKCLFYAISGPRTVHLVGFSVLSHFVGIDMLNDVSK